MWKENPERVLVTGGAGFIGSHLIDALSAIGRTVVVFDNFSKSGLQKIGSLRDHPTIKFVKGDLLNPLDLAQLSDDYQAVFHLAGNPLVNGEGSDAIAQFNQNVVATHNLLAHIAQMNRVNVFCYTSTSAVYGEATQIPTPEHYSPLAPISYYGATKLACEALVSAYAHQLGFRAVVFRLANVVGPRSGRGVVSDFIRKLSLDNRHLEVLGDGNQTKSYLHVRDCIDALLLALNRSRETVETYNVGPDDQIDVKTIGEIVKHEMGLETAELTYTGGNGGRGWKGDVRNMMLDCAKLRSMGWEPKLGSTQAVTVATRELIAELPFVEASL